MTLFLSEGLKERLSQEDSASLKEKVVLSFSCNVLLASKIIDAALVSCMWDNIGNVKSVILTIESEAAAYLFEENLVRALWFTAPLLGKTSQILAAHPDLTYGYSFAVTFENEKVLLKINSCYA